MVKLFAVCLTVSLATGLGIGWTHAEEPSATPDDFKQFGELLIGRWMGDITLIADWPGQAKKQGDKITGYSVYRWVADGKGFESEDIAGTTTGKGLFAYDATTKQIQATHVDSGGTKWQAIIWKKDAYKWGWKLIEGGQLDGKKLRGEGSWVFARDGKSYIAEGTVLLDGKELPQLRDVYTRVNQ